MTEILRPKFPTTVVPALVTSDPAVIDCTSKEEV
jgi:hypothetical protein